MRPTRRGIFGVLFGAATVPTISTESKSEIVVGVNSFGVPNYGNVHNYNQKEQRCVIKHHGWATAFGKTISGGVWVRRNDGSVHFESCKDVWFDHGH